MSHAAIAAIAGHDARFSFYSPTYGMGNFANFVERRTGPGAAELTSIIARAGETGISRKQLGDIFTLPSRLLNQLLVAHCGMGLLRASREGEETIYRTPQFAGLDTNRVSRGSNL